MDLSSAGERFHLTRAALVAIAAIFFLMGILGSAYGPLLEHLARRFEVSLSVAGGVLSAHFFGALLGVLVSMRALQRLPRRGSTTWTSARRAGFGASRSATA